MPGVLTLSVYEAKDLAAKDKNGFSDPFVDCTIGSSRKKTKIIDKNLNPVWNENLSFEVKEIPKKILVSVWDHDIGEDPDFLGQVNLELSPIDLAKGQVVDQWYTLEKRSRRSHISGSIHLGVSFTADNSLKISSATLTTSSSSSSSSSSPPVVGSSPAASPSLNRSGKLEINPEKPRSSLKISGNIGDALSSALKVSGGTSHLLSQEAYRRKSSSKKENLHAAGAGDLVVTVVKASNLIGKDDDGFSDPFVKLNLGTQKRESAVIPKNLNPEWNEDFIFKGGDTSAQKLEVSIWDDDKGGSTDFLGQVKIDMSLVKPGDSWERTFPLERRSQRSNVSGDITIKVERIPYTSSPKRQRPPPSSIPEGIPNGQSNHDINGSSSSEFEEEKSILKESTPVPVRATPKGPAVSKTLDGGEFSRAREVKDGKTNMYYKIIMVGDSGVGKTNIFSRYDRKLFSPTSVATVGVDFFSKVYRMEDNSLIKIQVWDTAGQERYQTVTKQYYRNSLGAVVVYDVSKRKTFEHVTHWLKELEISSYNDNMSILLLGNKCDLPTRAVSLEEGKTLASDNGMIFFETSALTGECIDEAFQQLLQDVHKKELQKPPEERGSKTAVKNTRKKNEKLNTSSNNPNSPSTSQVVVQVQTQPTATVEVSNKPPEPQSDSCAC